MDIGYSKEFNSFMLPLNIPGFLQPPSICVCVCVCTLVQVFALLHVHPCTHICLCMPVYAHTESRG